MTEKAKRSPTECQAFIGLPAPEDPGPRKPAPTGKLAKKDGSAKKSNNRAFDSTSCTLWQNKSALLGLSHVLFISFGFALFEYTSNHA